MNSKNIIICILFLTTVAGGVYGWKQNQRANDLETKNVTLNKDLRNAVRDSQRRPAAVDTAAAQPAADAPAPAPQRAQFQANMRAVMQSPAATKLMASQQRAMLDTRYAPLFKSLNLTPDQLAKFKDMLVDKQNAARDVLTVAQEQGLDPRANRAEIQQLIQQAQADVDSNIASIIGQDKLAQYQNYDQTAPQRAVVSQIAQSLSYTSDPLTPAQNDQLVALLAQNATQNNNGGGGNFMFAMRAPGGGGPMMQFGGQSVPITNDVINAAQSFLNANQLDALRQMQSQQSDQQQLQQMFQGGNGGGGGYNNNAPQPPRRRGGRGGGRGGN